MKHLWWQTITAWILLWKEASIVCSAGIPTRNITTVILRRSRKAGSGTLDAFLKDAIKAHPEVTTYEAKLGTMHPFDSCCLVPCAGSKPPWSDPSVFTVTHLREPLDWRQSEYWYRYQVKNICTLSLHCSIYGLVLSAKVSKTSLSYHRLKPLNVFFFYHTAGTLELDHPWFCQPTLSTQQVTEMHPCGPHGWQSRIHL